MLNRKAKSAFYAVAGPLMRFNGCAYRLFRHPKSKSVKLHLGPGQKNYLDGWVNIDANMFTGRCDLWADLRNKLPFRDSSVDAIYSHHVIEHLPDLDFHLNDAFRCLKPGGVYRIGGPDGDMAIKKFIEKDASWFHDFPDKRQSIGGKFENFIFCRGEHLTILTFSMLEELMIKAGFSGIKKQVPAKETGSPELFQDCLSKEIHAAHYTLVIEGKKPI